MGGPSKVPVATNTTNSRDANKGDKKKKVAPTGEEASPHCGKVPCLAAYAAKGMGSLGDQMEELPNTSSINKTNEEPNDEEPNVTRWSPSILPSQNLNVARAPTTLLK